MLPLLNVRVSLGAGLSVSKQIIPKSIPAYLAPRSVFVLSFGITFAPDARASTREGRAPASLMPLPWPLRVATAAPAFLPPLVRLPLPPAPAPSFSDEADLLRHLAFSRYGDSAE